MIRPRSLKKGSKVAIVGPASPTVAEKIDLAIEKVKEMGFEVVVGDSCYGVHGYLSGNDELRAKDINKMFADETVDGIWCIRGGYGTPRILSMLDYETIKKNPKVFIGYSDITAVHTVLNQKCDLVTFHGPMASTELIYNLDEFTSEYLTKNIMDCEPLEYITNPEGMEIETLVPGEAEGLLIGGNLSLIASTIGTPYEIDTKGKILFLEDIDEKPYRIDGMLTQLKNAGKLQEAAGIILGDWNNCVATEPEKSLSLMEIFNEIIFPLNIPTIYNVKVGHCKPMITFPIGMNMKLDATNKTMFIGEKTTI